MAPKSKAQAAANFEAAAPTIGPRYEAGVRAADWIGPAGSDQAETNFAAGIAKAVAAKRRQSKIRMMSNADWQTQAITKGGPIIGSRVSAAIPKWSATWGPMYDSVLSKLGTLKPKTVDFRVNITNRLVPLVEEWKRVSGKL